MVESGWIKRSLFLTLLLQITAGQFLSFTVRAGGDVSLTCEHVVDDQHNCEGTLWIFSGSGRKDSIELVSYGQFTEAAKAKSDRLSISEECSLVIKNATREDVGLYLCRRFQSEQQHGEDTQVKLALVDMSDREDGEQVMLTCSVSTHEGCGHAVKWTYAGQDEAERTSLPGCSTTVTFPASSFGKSKYPESLKCEVTDGYTLEVHQFPFSAQSSGEGPSEQYSPSFVVRGGDEVTLPCENVADGQEKCKGTYWIYTSPGSTFSELLVDRGQISEDYRSDSLGVTQNCFLVMKKVTAADVGRYTCRQDRSGQQHGPDTHAYLSVINMTEHEDTDKVTLNCSVSTYEWCPITVELLYQVEGVDVATETSHSECSVAVKFPSRMKWRWMSKYHELFRCKFTDVRTGKAQLFPFRPQSSGEKPRECVGTSPTAILPTTRSNVIGLARSIIVSLGLAALIISVVVVNIWTRTKGSKTQMEDNAVRCEEDEGTATYENVGETASVRLH